MKILSRSLDQVKATQKADDEVASHNEKSSDKFVSWWHVVDDPVIQDPVENDLQLIHWGNSSCLVILVSFCCENLGEEHWDTNGNDHVSLVPAIESGVSSAISQENDHK